MERKNEKKKLKNNKAMFGSKKIEGNLTKRKQSGKVQRKTR